LANTSFARPQQERAAHGRRYAKELLGQFGLKGIIPFEQKRCIEEPD
jgi:hypothetical protein